MDQVSAYLCLPEAFSFVSVNHNAPTTNPERIRKEIIMPLFTEEELVNYVPPATDPVIVGNENALSIYRASMGKVINEEGPMLPQNLRDELLEMAEASFSQIEAGIRKKERKIINSFDRSSYREWEYSPHQQLANSLEYLYGQMGDLREHIKQGSRVGITLLGRALRENWNYSFDHVDEELEEPQYNWRDEEQKKKAQQYHIRASQARKGL